jgi:small subunit ribosomal protein S13
LASEKNENVDKKAKAKASKDQEPADDFKYIVRIVNTDIDGNQTVVHALTAIKGIGDRLAKIIINKTEVPSNEKIGTLSDEDIMTLENFVLELSENTPGWLLNKQKDIWTGDDIHIFGNEMDMRLQDDINMLKKIRCYRGIRHEKGQKVRGQRTKAHGRSGLTVGVVKKAQKVQKTK